MHIIHYFDRDEEVADENKMTVTQDQKGKSQVESQGMIYGYQHASNGKQACREFRHVPAKSNSDGGGSLNTSVP